MHKVAEKISITKGFDNDTFDTYVPELSDNADIQNAFELFYYGNSEDGNATGDVSLHANLVSFDSRITSATSGLSGHTGAISDVHGIGAGNSVVGTGTTQTLTNKTLTSPKINENVSLTATSTELNYVDGVTSAIQTQIDTNTPIGMISPYSGSVSPTGWLLCDGSSYSTTTYANLFAVIGYTFGGTTGSFSVPNLKGRVIVGMDATQTEFDLLGEAGGAKTHFHTIAASNPIGSTNHDGHSHGVNDHAHGFNIAQTEGGGAHNHGVSVTNNNSGTHGHSDNFGVSMSQANVTALAPTSGTPGGQTARSHTHPTNVTGSVSDAGSHSHANTAATNGGGDHNHGLNITMANNSGTNANSGGSHSHSTTVPQHSSDTLSNLQPYLALNYIIKF